MRSSGLTRSLFVVALVALLPLKANAAVAYSQPHDGSGTLTQSSGNGMDYDMFVWDNFTLGSDQVITDIQWRGGYNPLIPPVYPSGPIQYFDVTIWGTVAGQPDIGAGPLALYEMVPNNETPAGTFGGTPMYDYSVSLTTAPFTPFHAVAGTLYWVRIGAFQPGVPGWGLASGSGGDGHHFSSFVNYAGGTQYRYAAGDAAFTLLTAAPVVDLCANVTCQALDQCHAAGSCDPATGRCSNPAQPDGTPCTDGNVCTGPDVCQAGVCQPGPLNAATCLDHFECYRVAKALAPRGQPAFPKFVSQPGVVVVDAFSTNNSGDWHQLDLTAAVTLCSPADTNGGDPAAPAHAAHLEAYKAKLTVTSPVQPSVAKIVHTIQNPLGTLKVKVTGLSAVMVSSASALGTAGATPLGSATVDHFKCYRATVGKAPAGQPPFPTFSKTTVMLTDEFGGPVLYDLIKPTQLCLPADVDAANPTAPADAAHLVCYQAKLSSTYPPQAKFAAQPVSTNNQFGSEVLSVKSVSELCVPSLRID